MMSRCSNEISQVTRWMLGNNSDSSPISWTCLTSWHPSRTSASKEAESGHLYPHPQGTSVEFYTCTHSCIHAPHMRQYRRCLVTTKYDCVWRPQFVWSFHFGFLHSRHVWQCVCLPCHNYTRIRIFSCNLIQPELAARFYIAHNSWSCIFHSNHPFVPHLYSRTETCLTAERTHVL